MSIKLLKNPCCKDAEMFISVTDCARIKFYSDGSDDTELSDGDVNYDYNAINCECGGAIEVVEVNGGSKLIKKANPLPFIEVVK